MSPDPESTRKPEIDHPGYVQVVDVDAVAEEVPAADTEPGKEEDGIVIPDRFFRLWILSKQ